MAEPPLLLALDLTGTFAFALNGAITGLEKAKLDIVGMLTLGMVTALGGGILRDITREASQSARAVVALELISNNPGITAARLRLTYRVGAARRVLRVDRMGAIQPLPPTIRTGARGGPRQVADWRRRGRLTLTPPGTR